MRLVRQTDDGRLYVCDNCTLSLSVSLSLAYTRSFHLIRLRHINEDVQWTMGVIMNCKKKKKEMCVHFVFFLPVYWCTRSPNDDNHHLLLMARIEQERKCFFFYVYICTLFFRYLRHWTYAMFVWSARDRMLLFSTCVNVVVPSSKNILKTRITIITGDDENKKKKERWWWLFIWPSLLLHLPFSIWKTREIILHWMYSDAIS
jgi:hypothetical protein